MRVEKTTRDPQFPKVLITGASGFIGRGLLSHLRACRPIGTQFNSRPVASGTTLVTIDLTNEQRVAELFDTVKPVIVFHLAALTSPGRNDKNPTLAIASHLSVTHNILKALPDGAHLVYLSTDKVFDGTDPSPDESAQPAPCCLYGELKLECENMIKLQVTRHHILRLPIVHACGEESSGSFIDSAIRDLREGKRVQAFANISRCFVKRDELIIFLGALVKNTSYGTYHIGSEMASYYERIKLLCDETQVRWRDQLVPTEGSVSPRLQNLSTAKVKQIFSREFS